MGYVEVLDAVPGTVAIIRLSVHFGGTVPRGHVSASQTNHTVPYSTLLVSYGPMLTL